jgi:hypothetical protein
MTRHLRNRIQKLEAQARHQPNEPKTDGLFFQRFLRIAAAYHLGNPTPSESFLSAYARVLGYGGTFEFLTALRAAAEVADPDLDARVSLANRQLLSKFGVGQHDEWDVFLEACRRMAVGLSEFYQRHVHLAAREFGVDADFLFRTED